jgi:rSAM/selenodomain-associated transferase 2
VPPALSVVVPVRDDAAALARTLDHLGRLESARDLEVVVAAAGDLEETRRVTAGRARLLVPGGSTRARLMNAGAAAATADVILFLHADSFPPGDAVRRIRRATADPRVVGGAFEHRFAEPSRRLGVIARVNRVRYRLTRNYYGDQGIFVRTSAFRRVGGYRDLALMEDLDLSRRLRRVGRTVLVREPLLTSGRRFLARGPLRTLAFIGWLLLLDGLGRDVQRYAERWRGPAGAPPGSPWPRGAAPGP